MAKGCVILLHGFLGNDTTLKVLQARLRHEGYDVLNIDYPSRKMTLEALADFIHPQVTDFLAEHPENDVHFVGHSLGGLVIRHYLHRHPCDRLRRTVMLGTPNDGTEAAELFGQYGFVQRIGGPVVAQAKPGHPHPELPPGAEAGVIAGRLSLNPALWLRGSSDGVISLESTRLKTPHSHTTLWAEHVTMPINPMVLERVVRFLESGKFEARTTGRA